MTSVSAGRVRDWPVAAFVALCLTAAVSLQAVREGIAPPRPTVTPTLWLQSPSAARRLMLSFTDLAADVYWMRAVVHYGGERRSQAAGGRFALLYPLLDMATTLDPNFDVAARLGAIFLSEGYPGGPGRTDQALALLEKGLRHDPNHWQYRHDMGFVYFWWLRDYQEAARQFELGAQLPGAPLWLRTMAGVTLIKGGDRQAARILWKELLDSTSLDWIRRAATNRLQQLQALDEIDQLTAGVREFTTRTGRQPTSWAELTSAGLLRGEPRDPTGLPYVLGTDAVVTLSPGSSLLPLPDMKGHP